MSRGIRAGLLIALVTCSGGCGTKPDRSTVYQIKTNDYIVEFDGLQKRATIGTDLLLIARIPEDIRVAEGTLRVGARDYGSVRRNDKISVVGGKVSVNGEVRTPSGP